ncbi:DUF2812 domain-containing protein [Anaerotignum sp.]|uniref:DUF2812 domain-containing protein n=1 Tax=Anaerotignum sp. TaxID=2039241 RepID=UPI00373600EE
MKRKQRLENFVFYDTESVTAHLEDMAQKGWALADVTSPLWTYEEIQPEKRTYRTAFYPAKQVYAPNAIDKQEEYIAYCEQAGWQYVTNWDNMLIFYTTAENPVPLETDEALRLEATHKAMKRSWLSVHGVLGVLFLLNIIFYIAALVKQPLTVIADGNAAFRNALFAIVLVYACAAVGSYLQWRKKSLSSVENGGFCLPVSQNVRRFQKIFFPLEIFAGLWFCLDRFLPDHMLTPKIFLAFVAVVFLLWLLFQKLHLPVKACGVILFFVVAMVPMFYSMVSLSLEVEKARENHTSPWGDPYVVTLPNGERETILLQKDEIPLTTADLTEIPKDAVYTTARKEQSSPLATKQECLQEIPDGAPQAPQMTYEIMDVSLDALTSHCLTAYQKRDTQPTPDLTYKSFALSGTDGAWQLYAENIPLPQYLFYKDSRIVVLRPDWGISQKELEQAASILLPESL